MTVHSPSPDLLSRSREPVYLQLATIFRRQIESGEWRQGERIPSLDALCRRFGGGPVGLSTLAVAVQEEADTI